MNTDISKIVVQSMSSKEIAKLTGKRHDHIIRDIKSMLNDLKKDAPFLGHEQYQVLTDSRGYTKEILLDKELTTILVSGYSVVMRAKIIRRWQELESQPPKFTLPPQYARYLEHTKYVPIKHYGAITVMQNGLVGPLSLVGHDLLGKLMPDGSFGRMFCAVLRKQGIDPKTFPTYQFDNLKGFRGYARAYPMTTYHIADSYLHDYWLPKHAPKYLKPRDNQAARMLQNAVPRIQFKTNKKQLSFI